MDETNNGSSDLKLMPPPDADLTDVLRFADLYNAYNYWGAPGELGQMLRPLYEGYFRDGTLSETIGIHAARAFLFKLYRDHHFDAVSREDILGFYRLFYERFKDVK